MKYYYNDKKGERCGPVDYGGLLTRIEDGNVNELTVRRARPGEEGYFELPVLTVHTLPALANLFFPGFGLFLQRRYGFGAFVMLCVLPGVVLCLTTTGSAAAVDPGGFQIVFALGFCWYFLLLCVSTISVMNYEIGPSEVPPCEISKKTEKI